MGSDADYRSRSQKATVMIRSATEAMEAYLQSMKEPGTAPPHSAQLGPGGARGARAHLQTALERAIAFQRKLIFVPVGIAVGLFATGLILVSRHQNDPKLVTGIFAGCGISLSLPFTWTMSVLRTLWRC